MLVRTTLIPAFCLGLLLVIGHDVRSDGPLATWDRLLLPWFTGRADDPWLVVVVAFTHAASPAALTVLACVVMAVLLRRERWHEAVTLGVVSLGASVLNPTVKALVHRDRPPMDGQLVAETTLSFPSGHTTGAVAVIGALALTAGRLRAAHRFWFHALAVVLVALVGLSRVHLGVHWPCDVLAGWLLGSAWLSAGTACCDAWRKRGSDVRAAEDLPSRG